MTNKVSVHAKLSVVPAVPVKPGKVYPLSILDHMMGSHTVHIVFYYKFEKQKQGLGVLTPLQVSLSDLLTHYPPVAGRLQRGPEGNWEVKCNDAGVRIFEAKVDTTIEKWLETAESSSELELFQWEEMPENPVIWSPFNIQITEFEGGGVAIGLSCPHMHADPTCATLLVKAWSEFHRRAAIVHPPFFLPAAFQGREIPKTTTATATATATATTAYYTAKSSAKYPPPTTTSTATFRFSDAAVKRLVSDIQISEHGSPDATPFDALAALFWTCAARAKSSTHAHAETRTLSICTEFRKRMHAPLPHGFYGNTVHFSHVSTGSAEMEEKGVAFAAHVVHDHLQGIAEDEYWSAIDWLESRRDADGGYASAFPMYGPELTCVDLEHVLAEGAVFVKDLKPLHVSYHVGKVHGEGLIRVLPSPEEGFSRTVMVTLPESQTSKLCEDLAILALSPTMLVSGGPPEGGNIKTLNGV